MKKIYLALLLIVGLAQAQEPTEDLPDFTPQFSIRSLYSGDILVSRKTSKPTKNWKIRSVDLKDLKATDPLEKRFMLGYVQFYHPDDENICIGIDETGFFVDKDCNKDITDKKWETIFSIMPTNTSAVQIRSLVLGKNECISVFHNPFLPMGRDFGINPCDLRALVLIDLRRLLVIAPAFGPSTLNN